MDITKLSKAYTVILKQPEVEIINLLKEKGIGTTAILRRGIAEYAKELLDEKVQE